MIEPQWIYRAAALIWLVFVGSLLWDILREHSGKTPENDFFRPALVNAALFAILALALAFIVTGRVW